MATYQSRAPGVYVEEVPSTPPIAGVGTSTAAFIGVVDNTTVVMPDLPDGSGKYALQAAAAPAFVTNVGQFRNAFGEAGAANQVLAQAVTGFFENGGTKCWVVRVGDLTNDTAVANVLERLAAIDEIAIVAAPGALKASIQQKIAEHCSLLKDRFAILDGQRVSTMTVAAITGGYKNEFAAIYFPWLRVDDLTGVSATGVTMPPSGHMAGIFARVDETRGVHKAPGNEPVAGARGLEYLVTPGEHDNLNPKGVNVIRSFRGDIRVWGARTLGGEDNGIRYVNVRRTLSFLRESIDEGTQWAVFEPNARPLWLKIKRAVGAFLTNVWRDGALFGDTPEQAFYVKCDESTNPPEVIALGQVVAEIGVAIVRPAEFVVFRISQAATLE